MPAPLIAENGPNSWIWWSWIGDHLRSGTNLSIVDATRQHVELTLIAVAVGLLVSLPLGVLAWRYRWLQTPVLGATGVLYTIPSLALFAFFVPITGLSRTTAEIGLIGYTLLILVRNVVTGLEGVPEEVREAARGMGFRPFRQLLVVDFPLALPAIVAGLRIATVTTIGLVTVTALIGQGGLGQLIYDGLIRDFHTTLLVGSIGCVLLAVVTDAALVLVERVLTPWSRKRAHV
jgi:osmoprotectant transport system permease protein